METVIDFWQTVSEFLGKPIFSHGNSNLTPGMLIYLVVGLWLVFLLSKIISRRVIVKLLNRYGKDKGVSHAIGSIFRYIFLFIGLIIVIQSTGVDLSALTVLAGALGVGIGFGLQSITNNFISGIIILFQRPIKVGDRVELPELDNLAGDVVNISARSTTIITNDNIAILIPNSKFVSDTVINWSYNDANVRFKIPVGVSYNEDPEIVRDILLEVANKHPGVLKSPAPDVLFDEYAESSLNFTLRVFTTSHTRKPLILKSELYFEIFKEFKIKGIEIPYPKRDVYIKQFEGETSIENKL
ncbi:MAG: mechanosensitive ion channel [Bacteroidales bacterium]|mgnify:CR=1 FL=1|nr:mechanosensitive ion channel [Bacteroidales bacterium]MDD4383832.1 mechanosensitive ion channel [Bacteroidales bacterium]MDY0196981.1 mechanosensitive ion channel [Tenuifilaceae bacterium]